ncbi:MAG: ribosome small subunit-dependent GTPase A [Acidimicrobiales bacterium]
MDQDPNAAERSGHSGDDLSDLGWDDRWQTYLNAQGVDGVVPARVLRHDGKSVLVGSSGWTGPVHLRTSTPPIAVGDWVLIDDDVVHGVLERKSLLQRRDPSTGNEQLIAANIDVVGIVCGLDRPVSPGRIERFVTLSWDAGAVPLVVLTKSDLVDDTTDVEDTAVAGAAGADVVCVSSLTTSGIDRLSSLLSGQTVAFVGESGAGKSALLNALAGRDIAATGDVRGGDHKGRHTTTARQLHSLPGRCSVIDTPGLREVGIWTDTGTVDRSFTDITELAEGCRFGDCTHRSEPGCAVQQAVEFGKLDLRRLENWEQLRREAASAELRGNTHAHRQAQRRFGKIVRQAQQTKRP